MNFNYDKLNGKIVEKYKTRQNFAKNIDMAPPTLSLKMNNKSEWTQLEMLLVLQTLGLDKKDVVEYFFTLRV